MNSKIDYESFEKKLKKIYPTLSKKEAKIIIKQLFKFWSDIIDNLDKIK